MVVMLKAASGFKRITIRTTGDKELRESMHKCTDRRDIITEKILKTVFNTKQSINQQVLLLSSTFIPDFKPLLHRYSF